jgi:hypothetical protein
MIGHGFGKKIDFELLRAIQQPARPGAASRIKHFANMPRPQKLSELYFPVLSRQGASQFLATH